MTELRPIVRAPLALPVATPGPMLPEMPRTFWRNDMRRSFMEWALQLQDDMAQVATLNDLRELGDRVRAMAETFYGSADAWAPHGEHP